MKRFFTLLSLLGICFAIPVQAQDTLEQYLDHVTFYSPYGIAVLEPQTVAVREIIETYDNEYLEDTLNTLVLERYSVDDLLHYEHYRYQQFYNGIEVEAAEMIEHVQNGYVVYINGKLCEGLTYPTQSLISEEAALATAMAYFPTQEFAWESEEWELSAPIESGDPNATYYPEAELIYALDNFNNLMYAIPPSRYTLCYRFDIVTIAPFGHYRVFVNALTNQVFRAEDLFKYDGPATTFDYGQQTIDTRKKTFGDFYLHADNGDRDIETRYIADQWSRSNDIIDNDDNWIGTDTPATSLHWYVTQAWDYFETNHNWLGMKGNGKKVRAMAAPADQVSFYDPGKWGYDIIRLGLGPNNENVIIIDAAGHEFTHGVDHYTAELANSGEPAALEEGFCDIFGFMTEYHAQGDVVIDWQIGEDGWLRRSLEDPLSMGHPESYMGVNWGNVSANNDSAHVNCNVLNKWFYLLGEGDIQNGVTVNAIDMNDLANICFSTLTNSLTTGSQYGDLAVLTILLTEQIHGNCSYEHINVMEAWEAIGIGTGSNCQPTNGSQSTALDQTIKVLNDDHRKILQVIKGAEYQVEMFRLYNMMGQMVLANQNKDVIDISDLNTGVYIACIQTNKGVFATKVFLP